MLASLILFHLSRRYVLAWLILFHLPRGHGGVAPARFLPLGPSWRLLKIRGLDLAKTPGDIIDPLPRTRHVPGLIPLAIMLVVITLPIAEQVGVGIGGVLHSWGSRDGGPLRRESGGQLWPVAGPFRGLPKIRGLDLAKTPGDVLNPFPRSRSIPGLIPPAILLIVIPLPIAEQVGIGIGGVLHSRRSRDGGPLRNESGEQLRNKFLGAHRSGA